MGKLVEPKVYWIGETVMRRKELNRYLAESGNEDFLESMTQARADGLSDSEILCSFYAKLCYASLTLGKNANVTRIRDIPDNLKGCFDQGHGSVFEHCQLNFVIRDCSRVFCYHPDTDVFTSDGWKRIELLMEGQEILTLNPSTRKAEWSPIISMHQFPYEGELYGWTTSQMQSPLMTPDHILWAARHDLRRVRQVSASDNAKLHAEKIPFSEVYGKPFVIQTGMDYDGHDEESILVGSYEYNAERLFSWLGWMATDGCVSGDRPNQATISQSKSENMPAITELMFELFGKRWRRHGPYTHSGMTQFTISDASLAEFCRKHLGPRKSERSLSRWILDASPRLLRFFAEAAISGDGSTHKKNGHRCLYVPCAKAAGQFQVLFARIGTPANLRVDDRVGQSHLMPNGSLLTNAHPTYVLDLDRRGTASLVKARHQFTVRHSGHVYCPKTENGIIFVRNTGKAFWAGNTHELVRHRVGFAFSQTSGRYVRGDEVNIVFDPILEPVRHVVEETQLYLEQQYRFMVELMGLDEMKDFDRKKKITSALRRLLPNGQTNEMGFSVNLRALRHTVQVRTSRHAEWEIRLIYGEVYRLVKAEYPLIFYGATEETVNGLLEVSGMKLQPYEKSV